MRQRGCKAAAGLGSGSGVGMFTTNPTSIYMCPCSLFTRDREKLEADRKSVLPV